VYHVLCEYETSDHDEVALQSFLCGQAPAVFGCFVTLLMRASNLDQTRYKHLRDVLDAPLDRQAFVRGRHAVAFVICDFAALAARSLPEVRRMLEIGPRAPRRDSHELQNSCGGKRTRPYFDRSV
jgi:ubiquinone biosynthesis protein COQ4